MSLPVLHFLAVIFDRNVLTAYPLVKLPDIATDVFLVKITNLCIHLLKIDRSYWRQVHVALGDLSDVIETVICKHFGNR